MHIVAVVPGGRAVTLDLRVGSAEEIKRGVWEREGIPPEAQVVSVCGRPVARVKAGTVVLVALRLDGGKGGFGSLLRGGNTRVGQKKTTNFDACRDLNGRRIRHASNEQRLAEWYADSKDRQLAALAEKHVRQLSVESRNFDEPAYQRELDALAQDVDDSLRDALKRPRSSDESQSPDPPSPKRRRLWDSLDDSHDSDDDDSSDEDSSEKHRNCSPDEDGPEEKEQKAELPDNDERKKEKSASKSSLPPPPDWI